MASNREAKISPPNSSPPETPLSRRHGAPAGPWPWMDFDHINHENPLKVKTLLAGSAEWEGYPQSLFPNWGDIQVERSGIAQAVKYRGKKCVIRGVDVQDKTPFLPCEDDEIESGDETQLWERHNPSRRPTGIKVRTLFLDQPTGPVLQIIGTRYKIEPFFFSSALHRIPSRYQEEDNEGSDLTLPFVRIIKRGNSESPVNSESSSTSVTAKNFPKGALSLVGQDAYLVQELLAIHMVRSHQSSTIISFHPENPRNTAAKHLQRRIIDAGYSVYWKGILDNTKDPTFLFLLYFWYALDFDKSVRFVLETPNPVRDERSRFHEDKNMKKECENLLSEIERLEMGRHTHTERLKNAIALLFSNVNINDSRQMQQLTSLAVLDSRAMRQVSLLTMVFLPASFSASIFGMNVKNFDNNPNIRGTLIHYLETAIPLTAFTIWVVLASQKKPPGSETVEEGWWKLAWPVYVVKDVKKSFLSRWANANNNDPSKPNLQV
ncbi:hypothetical protein BDZ94DRAFT_1308998 [Collybia nuda]|uniref:Uncharacterized protein n=1 Tax=Collybia nuda TaxID=64659 RepID=A0A9P6CEV4_9AGAR|nr:hypothetical protein BDZ94DRAFT_1308998 [Collybia nuda]